MARCYALDTLPSLKGAQAQLSRGLGFVGLLDQRSRWDAERLVQLPNHPERERPLVAEDLVDAIGAARLSGVPGSAVISDSISLRVAR